MKNTIYIATEIHAHEALAFGTESGAFVHCYTCLIHAKIDKLFFGKVQLSAIEKDKVGCLRTYDAEQRHLLGYEFFHIIHIGGNLVDNLSQPLGTLVAEGCSSGYGCKNMCVVKLALHQIAIVSVAQFLVGNNCKRGHKAGDIK